MKGDYVGVLFEEGQEITNMAKEQNEVIKTVHSNIGKLNKNIQKVSQSWVEEQDKI